MAQSAAEKKAKAHEYYMEYRKKGKKKGRKKGTSKKTSGKKGAQSSLLGVTTSGLNTEGTIEAAAIKDRIKKEMNAALGKAKTEDEKLAIRKEYANKANSEIAKLKADPKFAKAKATKSSSKGGSSKSSGGKSSGGSSKSGGTSSKKATSSTSSSATNNAAIQKLTQQISEHIEQLKTKLAGLSAADKAVVKAAIQEQIDSIKQKIGKMKQGL